MKALQAKKSKQLVTECLLILFVLVLFFIHGDWPMAARRFLALETHPTSIVLERTFWDTIDSLASSGRWQDWVIEKLKDKPQSVGRASYLRQLAHQAVLNEIQLNAQ